jgi:type I restriction enzyme S subunit
MRRWTPCTLGDIIRIKHGFAFAGEHFSDRGSHVVLTPGNFFESGGFRDKVEKEKWYSGEVPADYVLYQGDLLVAMTEQGEGLLGSSAVVPCSDRYLHNQRLGLVQVIDREQCDPKFIYYLFNSKPVRQQIRASASGTKIRHTSPTRIGEVKICLPPIEEQGRIAAILSDYDDLIEINRLRIKILEEMARVLYREWFILFRYPGHSSVRLIDSAIGQIPYGWTIKTLPECILVNPRVHVPHEGEKPFVPVCYLANDSMLVSGFEFRTGNSGSKFQNGDTLFARITPCLENGKTGFVQFLPQATSVAFGSTEFIVLRSKTLTPEFVYLLARSQEFRTNAIKSMSGASGRQRVQEKCFDRFMIAEPPAELLAKFSAISSPGFHLIQNLHLRNENLRRTREMLLPRLLSLGLSGDL